MTLVLREPEPQPKSFSVFGAGWFTALLASTAIAQKGRFGRRRGASPRHTAYLMRPTPIQPHRRQAISTNPQHPKRALRKPLTPNRRCAGKCLHTDRRVPDFARHVKSYT